MIEIPAHIAGWWRITETSQWVNDGLDDLGPAMISITGHMDRLRMHCLLAYIRVRATKAGASFSWQGAWEYDPMSGTGSVKLGKDGRLRGWLIIKDGDESTFVAMKAASNSSVVSDRSRLCCPARQGLPRGGPRVGNPRWRTIFSATSRFSITEINRIGPEQRGHTKISIEKILLKSCAHRSLRSRPGLSGPPRPLRSSLRL